MKKGIAYAQISTEKNLSTSRYLDRLSPSRIFDVINNEDRKVPLLVSKQKEQILRAVSLLVNTIKNGGRIFLFGAGTSGRLAVMEAAECPPTFNTPPSLLQSFMAGGRSSVFRSQEGAEDRGQDSRKLVARFVRRNDAVIGVAASGVTAYVEEALNSARKKKAASILVTCNPGVPNQMAQVVIRLNTGPEVIAGSTRLKAATATKLTLNTLTVMTMAQVGKIYGNKMVDLQPRSKKLMARAVRLISEIGGVPENNAKKFLSLAKGQTKKAIVMARTGCTLLEATKRLNQSQGQLHLALLRRGSSL